MKQDIKDRKDIDRLMLVFYTKAIEDEVIGFIFTDVAKLDLDHHLPIIGDFWETMLFRSGNYARYGRNPLEVHGKLSKTSPLLPKHFDRWLEIFHGTTDELFEGDAAEFIKFRADAIGRRMLAFVTDGRSR